MYIILLLCFKLLMLHCCATDLGYRCNKNGENPSTDPVIYLVRYPIYDYRDNDKLNSMFRQSFEHIYKIIDVSLQKAVKNNYSNVVFFGASYFIDGIPDDYVYAGDIINPYSTEKLRCIKTSNKKHVYNCNNLIKVVSRPVNSLDGGNVISVVQNMQHDSVPVVNVHIRDKFQVNEIKTVLLCSDFFTPITIRPLNLITASLSRCERLLQLNSYRLLAVLIPKLYNELPGHTIPTIFYETSYMNSEIKTAFPNSMTLVRWQLLKYGFLKFLQKMGWKRVVIVSDDSEYSLEFEGHLTQLFHEEGIVHTVVQCEDAACDMDVIRKKLVKVSARVVIANVKEENALYLLKRSQYITWLVRDLDENAAKKLKSPAKVISIGLGAKKPENDMQCNGTANVLSALNSIVNAYNQGKYIDTLSRLEFYRQFITDVSEINRKTNDNAMVLVKRYPFKDKTGRDHTISTMSVNTEGAEIMSFRDPFVEKPSDGTFGCLATSYDYFHICQDKLVLPLMFVVVLFLLMVLTIICYFDKTSPVNDIRYHNFF